MVSICQFCASMEAPAGDYIYLSEFKNYEDSAMVYCRDCYEKYRDNKILCERCHQNIQGYICTNDDDYIYVCWACQCDGNNGCKYCEVKKKSTKDISDLGISTGALQSLSGETMAKAVTASSASKETGKSPGGRKDGQARNSSLIEFNPDDEHIFCKGYSGAICSYCERISKRREMKKCGRVNKALFTDKK